MNTSLNWLTEYVDVDLPADKLGDLFTSIGLNCDGIEESDNDIVFDLETTSNRPDWLGHIGLARELAVATGKPLRKPTIELPAPVGKVEDLASVTVEEPKLCPRYTARVLRNVKVGPSPQWMVDYLEAIGLRSINNIVDVTNFVLMEYGQPLHSFDYDKLAGHAIVVRRGRQGETLVSIDETTCNLTDQMLVIADAKKPVAIAGIMGGLDTEVTEMTTNVLLEAAEFDPLTTRHTSRALGILSDSNYRYERGIDPVALDEASLRACQLILQTAGGELAEGVLDVWANPWTPTSVTLRPERTNALLGIDVPRDEQVRLLAGLGLQPTDGPNSEIVCTAPPFRRDLTREADLIEEVARLHGYDQIPIGGKVSHPVLPLGMTERIRRMVGQTLTAAGFDEAVTFSFVDAAECSLFGVPEPVCVDAKVRRTNNALRPTLRPSLLRAVKSNQDAGNDRVWLYELAAVFPPNPQGELPAEFTELAMVCTGDLQDLRGALEAVISRICPQAQIAVQPGSQPGYQDGISASVLLDGEPIGTIGRADAAVVKNYGLETAPALAAVRLEAIRAKAQLVRTASVPPRFPSIQRDLSLIVDDHRTWGEMEAAIRDCNQPLRVQTDYVTTYRGKPIAKGSKSVTIRLEYRSDSGTLTGEQVDQEVACLLETMKAKFPVELRV